LTRDLEHEAVELRLGQRIGAFLLDRVLRRQHEERARAAGSVAPPTVTCRSCIASSSAACVFGGARLISSASTMLAKIGPSQEREARACRWRSSSITSVPVMSAGIRSGVNWMRLKLQVEAPGQRADQQRLGQAGHALEQAVAPAEERDQQLPRPPRATPTITRESCSMIRSWASWSR
jgi:hypothetical protein